MIFYGSSISTNLEYEGLINIETSISNKGLPTFEIFGLVSKSIVESKNRIIQSFESVGISFPLKNISINLSPGEVLKDGAHYDLAMAATLLKYTNQIDFNPKTTIFFGELSFDGSVKAVKNILFLVLSAYRLGIKNIYVPKENSGELDLPLGINLYLVDSLKELLNLTSIPLHNKSERDSSNFVPSNFLRIVGNYANKRILSICLAGNHNLLLKGFPGTGKSLLAKASCDLLPDLTDAQAFELGKLYSYSGVFRGNREFYRPPFRAPHATSSYSSIFGGSGRRVSPGELSLAHRGVLFLDEIPEFNRTVLEGLRQPLEDRVVTISRAVNKKIFNTDFILIAAMNPCKCGYFNHPKLDCKCSPFEVKKYQNRISGPVLDRIDVQINIQPSLEVLTQEVQINYSVTEFENLRNKIKNVLDFYNEINIDKSTIDPSISLNNNIIQKFISNESRSLIHNIQFNYSISNRRYFKILKLALTICLFENSTEIKPNHILEALSLSVSQDFKI